MSWSKLGYLLRTSPISDLDWSVYDKGMKQNLEHIVGVPLSDSSWSQATLPIRLGGLGLLVPSKLVKPALLGSLLFTEKLASLRGVDVNSEPLGLRRQLSEIKADLGLPNDFVVPVHGQKTLSILSHQKTWRH